MPTDCISFRDTNYFSSLICDYLDEKEELKPFYNRYPNLENFENQIKEKQAQFSKETRKVLTTVLLNQYKKADASEETLANIKSLHLENTFTVTTGHQLNLFTGPLYFLYKIVSTINLTKELKDKYPNYNFVPVYWMATEDHDFDEINFFNFQGKKIQWSKEVSGAVGRLNTKGLENVSEVLALELGIGQNAAYLTELFTNAYTNHDNLADATRYLANELFGGQGLVILDADNKDLKEQFIPYIKEEIDNASFKQVSKTNNELSIASDGAYKIQVNPREINLFYLRDDLRERIVEKDGGYVVNETNIFWTKDELITEIENHPDRFSPNVIMRPLYQEVILPNLCYIGGGGELAYWMQLKAYFNKVNVVFPMLLLRNSVVIKTPKQSQKIDKLELSMSDLFMKQDKLVNAQVKRLSHIDIDFSSQKAFLQKQFEDLYSLAKKTDKTFLGAVAAQEKKQIKGLNNLEKRLLKAQKRNLSSKIERITAIQDQLFPGQSLQERNTNFSEFYLHYGDQLIHELVLNLQPLKSEFLILEL